MLLKFDFKSFEELDTPNLLINIWSYSDHLNEKNQDCLICGTYRKYCIEIVKRRFNDDFGFFNEVIKNITKNNKDFIDLSQYSTANRHQIMDDLKKIAAKQFSIYYLD